MLFISGIAPSTVGNDLLNRGSHDFVVIHGRGSSVQTKGKRGFLPEVYLTSIGARCDWSATAELGDMLCLEALAGSASA